jgi:hypothetical protein
MDKTKTIGKNEYQIASNGAVTVRTPNNDTRLVLRYNGIIEAESVGLNASIIVEAYAIQQKHFEAKRKAEAERAPNVALDPRTHEWVRCLNEESGWRLRRIVPKQDAYQRAIPIKGSIYYDDHVLVVAAADDLASRGNAEEKPSDNEPKCDCYLTQNQVCDVCHPCKGPDKEVGLELPKLADYSEAHFLVMKHGQMELEYADCPFASRTAIEITRRDFATRCAAYVLREQGKR